jgi:type IV pilus assembly protein PilY1
MFSIYNDAINNRVLVSDNDGNIQTHTYSSGSMSIADTKEGIRTSRNLNTALDSDGGIDTDTTTAQDAIAACQTNTDAGGTFHATGTASCFRGTKFTFEGLNPEAPDGINVPETSLRVTERIDGEMQVIDIASAKYVGGQLIIEFNGEKVFNPGGSTLETAVTTPFNVATSCTTSSGIEERYDYSQLGETWSTPRIARIPSTEKDKRSNPDFDSYVAIMGGGMGNTNLCAGSAVFIVNLEDNENPGSIYGAEVNGGPITIIDTELSGISVGATTVATPNASDIGNSLPSSAVVITPDTAYNIPWRGAMVYFNDLEGKITKINLTSSTKNDASLFDQTTLFRLNADTENKRYSYFSMDAGIGLTANEFWLFGGTGNFADIGGGSTKMDNILYGIKDPHYPYFKHLNDVHVPSETDDTFLTLAHQGANQALSVDDAAVCVDTTGKLICEDGPGPLDLAWVIHLDEVDKKSPKDLTTVNTYRKLSAAPTLFKGQVYFPIYEPPAGANKCNVGNAYICVADDECGINNSHLLTKGGAANDKECKFVREGILSELVIFGDKLFANVAGPKEDADTLYSVLAAAGEVSTNKGNWRESGF